MIDEEEILKIAEGISHAHAQGLDYVYPRVFQIGAHFSRKDRCSKLRKTHKALDEWCSEVRDRFAPVDFKGHMEAGEPMIIVEAHFPCMIGGVPVDDDRYPPIIEDST